MYIYAILDTDNICVGVSYLCGSVTKTGYVQISESMAATVVGMKYSSGTWVAVAKPEYIETQQELIATKAVLSSGNVVLTLPASVTTGTLVKFVAPCACTSMTGGIVIDGTTYSVVDGLRKAVAGMNCWTSNALVAVTVNTSTKLAYIVSPIMTVADKTKLDSLPEPADYVVSTTTSGRWKVVVWASGRKECWKTDTLTGVSVSVNASGFYRSANITVPLPTAISSVDQWHLDVGPIDESYNLLLRLNGWKDSQNAYLQAVSLNGSETNVTIPYSFYVAGT